MEFYITRFKNIEKLTYDIEVITPMFLGGAEPKKAELRVPPIKGLLRFWWRALHPHLVDNNNFKKLKEEEAKLFGDSGEKFGKSKTKISINYDSIQIGEYRPLPHSQHPNKKFKIKCVKPGQRFNLILSAPNKVHSLFKLVSLLGGIGKRSRRGFGSFRITNLEIETNLENILNIIKKIIETDDLYEIKNNKILIKNNFSANYPYLKSIEIGRTFSSYHDVLIAIGQTSHDYNSNFTGFIKPKRLASPIYVSVYKFNNNFYPIITTLNLFSPIRLKGNDTRKNFIRNLK